MNHRERRGRGDSERFAYQRLCRLAKEADVTLKLGRDECGWGLLLVRPGPVHRKEGHALGCVFPDLSELERHAAIAMKWMASITGHDEHREAA